MKLSGLHSYSQRLNSHIFLLTSLVLTFEVWLWKSLTLPRKTNRKTQRAVLYGITPGCLRRYYLCFSQSAAKMVCIPVKTQDVPFLRTLVYTSAQGQGGGTKCRPSSSKIHLCHSSASLCDTPPLTATATYLYPKKPLEQGRLPAGQGQDRDVLAHQDQWQSYTDWWEQHRYGELLHTSGAQPCRGVVLVTATWRRDGKMKREGSLKVSSIGERFVLESG